jgi:hypothetical protein
MSKAQSVERLSKAVVAGDTAVLQSLLKAENLTSVINTVDEDGYTPLYQAARKAELLPVLKLLLEHGADPNIRGTDNESPLYIAAFNGLTQHVAALIAANASLNDLQGAVTSAAEMPLHAAARLGHGAVVQQLLAAGADINARNAARETPLYVAAKMDKPYIVYDLLTAGANATLQNRDGKDALYVASERGHKHCVQLLQAGSGAALKDTLGFVKAEMKDEKPALLSTDELMGRLSARQTAAADDDAAVAEILKGRHTPAPPAAPKPSATAAAAASTAPVRRPERTATPPSVPAPPTPAPAAESAPEAPTQPRVFRTRDPLTGEVLPPCRTLAEVGPDAPRVVPAGAVRDFKELHDLQYGGTVRMVGTGCDDETPLQPLNLLPEVPDISYFNLGSVVLGKQEPRGPRDVPAAAAAAAVVEKVVPASR